MNRRCKLVFPYFFRSRKRFSLGLRSLLILPRNEDLRNIREIRVGDYQVTYQLKSIPLLSRMFHSLVYLKFEIPQSDFMAFPIHNPVRVRFGAEEDPGYEDCPLMFNAFLPKYIAARAPYYGIDEADTVAFFRQSMGKNLTLTVRNSNVTDSWQEEAKLLLAFFLSRIVPKNPPVLFYEKNGRHYEESAKVVFETLVDQGYENAKFIINKETANKLDIEEKYQPFFVYQYSLKHYFYFFKSNVFIGTEVLSHALELRCQNILVQRKQKSKNVTFVFLQHGVMYMLSLDSPERASFRKANYKGRIRVVVSSQKEAEHFICLGGYDEKDLIISGLPKFDRSFKHDESNRILIMPTWRIWEFNDIKHDPSSTKYYRMIEKIRHAVPDELKERVIVAPHPLFSAETLGGKDHSSGLCYDEILRDVSVLITDYSSIAYDAFYRGSNVIFYWEEKDECLSHYGEPTRLLLDQENAFGPICYDEKSLQESISQLYQKAQNEKYLARYSSIVEFHDGKNTERLIARLRDEKIL